MVPASASHWRGARAAAAGEDDNDVEHEDEDENDLFSDDESEEVQTPGCVGGAWPGIDEWLGLRGTPHS